MDLKLDLKNLNVEDLKAKILQFGYDTVGMGAGRGFEKIGFALICHGGDSKDTLCVVEKKIK